MHNVVCFSGFCEDLGKEHRIQLRDWFNHLFKGNYHVFGHVCDDSNARILKETFKKAIVQVEPNVPIQLHDIRPGRFKTGVERYVQQIHAYRKVNSLRKAILGEQDADRIVRCRYDLLFYSGPKQVTSIADDEIGIPDFHHWGGYNDRMAIMGGKVANHYMDIMTELLKDRHACIHPEKNLKRILDSAGVKVKMINVLFNRVRNQSLELNDCGKDRPWRYPENQRSA